MKIIDTIPFFLKNYQPSLEHLKNYYNEYPEVFNEYFAYHCKNTDERLNQAVSKYPEVLSNIKEVHQNIIPIIKEITEEYYKRYKVSFPIEVNLIIGGFGSNAYTHRQIIPNITFALEKLSPEPDHLKTIVAHEFGHAAHNILSDESGIQWENIKWTSPLTWLNQEGAAIHFSRGNVAHLHPSIYFHFNEEGYEWLTFANSNKNAIKWEFAQDYRAETPQSIFREWFSIHGGKKFGFSRLGYFLGDIFFQNQIMTLGEMKAIIAWKEKDFEEQVENWLYQK
ncbi:hypothetical protein [Rossellomorea aquimaris]|uniref:hypothetical protein n=1 Tax=Rossellomorea aquimaris TaxID=189382 RepID=UPI0007D0AA8C|nr:hypothetical protein [Rossellomorea aquimaris]